MSKTKFVLDSNVLVSAALFKGSIARQAFDTVTLSGSVMMSEPVLAELREVFIQGVEILSPVDFLADGSTTLLISLRRETHPLGILDMTWLAT